MDLRIKDASDFGEPPRERPDCYPGSRPEYSYLLHEGKVHELHMLGKPWDSKLGWDGGTAVLGDVLEGLGLPSLQDWYGVLAYGSNACPPQLVHKDLGTVVVLKCRMFNIMPVYAGYMSDSADYIPATLARMEGREVGTWMTLLDPDDLDTMDGSEGRSKRYMLAEVEDGRLFLENGKGVEPIYAYVTKDPSGIFLHRGELVPLADVEQGRMRELHGAGKLQNTKTSNWLSCKEIDGPPPKFFYQMI